MIARSTFSRGTLVGCAVYCRGSFCVTSLCVGVNANVRSLQIIGGIMCVKNAKVFLVSWSWFSAQEEVLV